MSPILIYTTVALILVMAVFQLAYWMHGKAGRRIWTMPAIVQIEHIDDEDTEEEAIDNNAIASLSFRTFSPCEVTVNVILSNQDIYSFSLERDTLKGMIFATIPNDITGLGTWFVRGKTLINSEQMLVVTPNVINQDGDAIRLHVALPYKLLAKALISWEDILPHGSENVHLADEIDADLYEMFESKSNKNNL